MPFLGWQSLDSFPGEETDSEIKWLAQESKSRKKLEPGQVDWKEDICS
jgi:hypothetical protein